MQKAPGHMYSLTKSMKYYISILTLFISSAIYSQSRDTVFLLRETADTPYAFYHAVFIDTSQQFRTRLTNFSFDAYDSSTYFKQLKGLRLSKEPKLSRNRFPRKWVALYRFKGKYYLYHPSDFGNHFRFEITDSTTIDFTMEGPEPSRVNKITFISPAQAVVDRTNYWEGNRVTINLVDTAKGIAVFTFSPAKYNKETYQVLMVDAGKAYLFPVIVNYCLTDKQAEFDFDKIDFKALMK